MNSLLFLLGIAFITFGISYSLWTKVRVVRLRQDIYDQRDELFDVAISLDACSDPAYKAARQHLNSLAFIAKDLSLPLMIHAFSLLKSESELDLKSENPELQAAIETVFEWSGKRVYNYLMNETLHGWLLRVILSAASEQETVRRHNADQVESWIRSEAPVRLEKFRYKPDCSRLGNAIRA